MKEVKTYTATIYVGLLNTETGAVAFLEDVEKVCQHYVDAVGLCVTITPTRFIYMSGNEPGCIVGLINYPRFPSTPEQIETHAIRLANRLKKQLSQKRISIVFPDKTIMLDE